MSTADILLAFLAGRPVTLDGPDGRPYSGRVMGVRLESGFSPPATATHLLVTIGDREFYVRTEG